MIQDNFILFHYQRVELKAEQAQFSHSFWTRFAPLYWQAWWPSVFWIFWEGVNIFLVPGSLNWTQYPELVLPVLNRREGSLPGPADYTFMNYSTGHLWASLTQGHIAGLWTICCPPKPQGPGIIYLIIFEITVNILFHISGRHWFFRKLFSTLSI